MLTTKKALSVFRFSSWYVNTVYRIIPFVSVNLFNCCNCTIHANLFSRSLCFPVFCTAWLFVCFVLDGWARFKTRKIRDPAGRRAVRGAGLMLSTERMGEGSVLSTEQQHQLMCAAIWIGTQQRRKVTGMQVSWPAELLVTAGVADRHWVAPPEITSACCYSPRKTGAALHRTSSHNSGKWITAPPVVLLLFVNLKTRFSSLASDLMLLRHRQCPCWR